jgi:hypothetical protein
VQSEGSTTTEVKVRDRASLWLVIVVTAACLLAPATSWGDAAQDRAVARSLFDQARKLASEGKYTEACPKFEESQKLVPGIGTLFNLADCYAQIGRTASAWGTFLEVASQAKAQGQAEREKAARTRAAELEGKLVYLTVNVPSESRIAGLEVKRDGAVVSSAVWGTGVPVDPGSHAIEASAPGRATWRATVETAAGGPAAAVAVPVLQSASGTPAVAPPPTMSAKPAPSASARAVAPPAPPLAATPAPNPAPAPAPAQKPGKPGGAQRAFGLVAAGVGVVGLGVGAVFALGAQSKANKAKDDCDGNKCRTQEAVDRYDQAVKQADLASVLFGVGGTLLVGGAILYLTAPSESKAPTAEIRPQRAIVATPGGLLLKGTF